MKINRKYLLGLTALVIVAMLGTIGGMAFAVTVEKPVSNTLTLGGNSEHPHKVTLAWTKVEGGTIGISGEDATVTWLVGTPYLLDILQTNSGKGTETGIYGKITGIDFAQFTVEYLSGGIAYDLGTDVAGPKLLGFFDGTTYYFGPKGGDTLDPLEVQTFNLRVTPLIAVPSIGVSIVDVTKVTDPR